MKTQAFNAPSAPAPAAGYVQALLVSDATRWLFISGQIPQAPTGSVPRDFPSQARLAWAHVLAQLAAADLAIENLVKVTIFLASRTHAVPNREIRQSVLGEHAPALTVIIADIFDERWLLEIEAIAAA